MSSQRFAKIRHFFSVSIPIYCLFNGNVSAVKIATDLLSRQNIFKKELGWHRTKILLF